jgi:hypothetical protein
LSTYERGDYVKVEFPDEAPGIGEWMWMIVDHVNDRKRLVYGVPDNEPVDDYGGEVKLGSLFCRELRQCPGTQKAI